MKLVLAIAATLGITAAVETYAITPRAAAIKSGEQIHIVVPNGVKAINFRYYQQGQMVVNQNLDVSPSDRFIITVQ